MPIVDPDCGVYVDWSSLDLETFTKITEMRNFIIEYRNRESKQNSKG
jgi:hypothetical protein